MDIIRNIIEYVSITVGTVMLVKTVFSELNIYQQSHYHISGFQKIVRYYYIGDKTNFLYPLIVFLFFLDKWYVQLLYILYLALLLVLKFRRRDIVKLKITARIKRLCFIILIVKVTFGSALLYLLPLPQLMSAMVCVILISPFLVFVSAMICLPIELMISRYYQCRAQRKLSCYQTKVIGITGSFGKTSTKMILQAFMKDRYIVYATEKSFNTINGVCKNINEQLKSSHEYLIAEMGATKSGDIRKLVSLTHPKYGIVTEVGPQHLQSFKTIDTILREKMSLIASLPKDGIGVVNGDNPLIRNYKMQPECRVVTFGIDEPCDYRADNISIDLQGISFTVQFHNQSVFLRSPLLGKHNIYNILAAFALATELGVPSKDIVFEASLAEPVKNRLSIQNIHGFTVIDDAFNSNPIGFRNALDVLSMYPKTKVLITPGIVEAGREESKLNYELAGKIREVCDLVILVKTKSSLSIKKGLDDAGYTNVMVVDSYFDAMRFAESKYRECAILIENDVTDIYKL
jgi:UDP-N-acetylmuramoyl-tripeptide--D-alanyl-D-alanine ligase